MIAVYIVIGFVAGGLICFLLMRLQQSKIERQNALLSNNMDQLKNEKEALNNEKESLLSQ